MKRSLSRAERLRGRSEIRRVFSAGKSAERKGIKLAYVENNLSWNRIVVCPARGFRTAVRRNRDKRICREAYRTLKDRIPRGYDIAFVLYPGEYGYSDRLRQIDSLLERVGLKR
jgi:ribonuclease P protein component